MISSRTLVAASLFATACLATSPVAVGAADKPAAKPATKPAPVGKSVDRGRYLVQIAGCNDCHTSGYMQMEGKIPEAQWLTGDSFGWRGPWGTTYAVNLRLYMQNLTEEQWVKLAHELKARPPMPAYNLHAMTQDDLRAIYRYVRHAGPAGSAAPAYVPPDQEPKPPFAQFPSPPK